MVRGWASPLLLSDWVDAEVDVGFSSSGGIGRVVTIWVTFLEKNLSSFCRIYQHADQTSKRAHDYWPADGRQKATPDESESDGIFKPTAPRLVICRANRARTSSGTLSK